MISFSNFLIKPLLALAVALPVATTLNVQSADAHHRKTAAIIAGAIIVGGAIAYHNRKKYRYHRYHKRHRGVRYHRHRCGYKHRHHRHGRLHYHRGKCKYRIGRHVGFAH